MSLLSVGVLALPLLIGTLPDDVQSVVAANNQLAWDLYRRLPGADNCFLSPYSITKTLAMAYTGARGDTAREMATTLHFTLGPDQLPRAFAAARQFLNGNQRPLVGGRRGVQLHLAACLWGQKGYGFNPSFLALTKEDYGAGLQEVDFHAPEQARQTVNAWAQQQTHDKIRELFPPEALDTNTRLVLASAIYFKGDWTRPFAKDQTREEPFWVGPTKQVPVRMMHQTAAFGYFETGTLQVLQLPYQGGDLAMVVLLPKKEDGLADLEKSLPTDRLANWVGQLREQKVQVTLPKWTLTGAFSLRETLSEMGMRKAFQSGAADFSGMNDGREPLWINAVHHRAFIDVHEEGTEAAAATGAVMTTLELPSGPQPPVFRADHPFVFLIRDVRTGTILFLGRLVQP